MAGQGMTDGTGPDKTGADKTGAGKTDAGDGSARQWDIRPKEKPPAAPPDAIGADGGGKGWIEIDDRSRNSRIDIAPDITLSGRVVIQLRGEGHVLEIGPGTHLTGGLFELRNHRSALRVGAGCQLKGQYRIRASDAEMEIGAGTTVMAATLSLHEPGRIVLGRDCMLSGDIQMDVSDMHSILDAETGQRLNPPADIEIGDHVWIGQGARVLKGVRIGKNSIIGSRALVTRDVPEGCVAVGMPARVIREGVTWDRRRLPW